MGRLIDANANREKFKKIVYRTLNDCNITTKKKFNIIMTAFDNMPTAYDISKVVAELESKRDYKTIDNYYGETIGAIEIRSIDIGEAIEIVKAGGVE